MARIKDLPVNERPREKALHFGVGTLSDEEVLALLIGSGCKDYNAIEISHDLLSNSYGIYFLFDKSIPFLKTFKGVGESCALRIAAAFEIAKRYKNKANSESELFNLNPPQIFEKYHPHFKGLENEEVLLIIMNRHNKILHEETLYKGNSDSVPFSPSEIIRRTILYNGYKLVLLHNHPSGNPSPSSIDIIMTEELMKDCKRLKVKLVDHIIIANSGYYSFSENNADINF